MQHVPTHHGPRRGFTLVEMLVVITIIGILVALLIPTVGRIMKGVRNSATATELNDLARAMEAYKSFANDFPPDFTNTAALTDHIAKAFPRNTRNVTTWLTSQDGSNPKRNFDKIDPAEAIVVWLSMLSTNPRDPLSGIDGAYTGERKVIFDFKTERLVDVDGDGWMEFAPSFAKERPYVYFDGRVVGGKYAYETAVYPQGSAAPSTNEVVRPYRSNTLIDNRDKSRTMPNNTPTGYNTSQWMKPGQFQIIFAGQDNLFGFEFTQSNAVVFKTFPQPNYPLPSDDEDNMADFSDGKTFGESIP
jgi:prepilin-type N-terminal cleavage/methylation domain-containing protein